MLYRFSNCVLDDHGFTLTRDGQVQPVEPQVFDLLLFLVRNPETLISKDQLIDAVWAGRLVSESAISARISAARNAVGDDGKSQAIIRTIPRRGFRFVAKLQSQTPDEPRLKQKTGRQKIRYATADDGVKIAYALSGNGPPLIRTAHHPTHLELDWEEPIERQFIDGLGKTHTVIRLDQRGCGLSDLRVDDFSTTRSAKDVKAVADDMGLREFALLGSSSGALIATEFATMFPHCVSRMILLGGYVDGRSVRNGAAAQGEQETILKMAEEGWETPDSAFVYGYLSVYFPTATQEQLRPIARNLQNSCPKENEVLGRDFYNNHSIAGLLERVKTPTLVLHSKGDEVHPLSEGQKLAKGIANAELAVLDSRNHNPLPQEECWQIMFDLIEDFLLD